MRVVSTLKIEYHNLEEKTNSVISATTLQSNKSKIFFESLILFSFHHFL